MDLLHGYSYWKMMTLFVIYSTADVLQGYRESEANRVDLLTDCRQDSRCSDVSYSLSVLLVLSGVRYFMHVISSGDFNGD